MPRQKDDLLYSFLCCLNADCRWSSHETRMELLHPVKLPVSVKYKDGFVLLEAISIL